MAAPSRSVMIVGGGTAGWMTAAALARHLRGSGGRAEVTLLEAPGIPTIGVGEATLPSIRDFNRLLGVDPVDFVCATKATFKLGIRFEGWSGPGSAFFHGFGDYGPFLSSYEPHELWLEFEDGQDVNALESLSLACTAARSGRFAPPDGQAPPGHAYSYAFHFDASLYADYLRRHCLDLGVRRIRERITSVEVDKVSNSIRVVETDAGREHRADLFIDCSGFASELLGKACGVAFESWADALPCDRALTVLTEAQGSPPPFTRAIAHEAGWQWRIPLQHRTGNGIVFSSAHMSEDAAAAHLLASVTGKALSEPRRIPFRTGRRASAWTGNCIAIGLSAGFIEPLESTSINQIERGVTDLLELFPDADVDPALAGEYNRRHIMWFDEVKDFVVMHYRAAGRADSPFWRTCRSLRATDNLAARLELFTATGRILSPGRGGFSEASWLAVMLGLGLRPRHRNGRLSWETGPAIRAALADRRNAVESYVGGMPLHHRFIQERVLPYCKKSGADA